MDRNVIASELQKNVTAAYSVNADRGFLSRSASIRKDYSKRIAEGTDPNFESKHVEKGVNAHLAVEQPELKSWRIFY